MTKYHTYFVSWVTPNTTPMHIGNCTFATELTGDLLVKDAINAAQHAHPEAVVLNICKLD